MKMKIEERIIDGEDGVKVKTFIVDGEVLSPEGLEAFLLDLDKTKKETLRGFHEKTTELSTEKKSFNEEVARLNQEKAAFNQLKDAFETDKNFYLTHEPGEWKEYQSSFKKLTETGVKLGSISSPSPELLEMKKELEVLKGNYGEVSKKLTAYETESITTKADATVKEAEKLINSTYPLADISDVKLTMFKFFSDNRRIPTDAEIKSFVKADHDKKDRLLLKYGVKREEGKKEEKELLPSKGGAGSGGGTSEKKDIPSLNDIDAVSKAGRDYFTKRKELRK
jgi:hypothetical protein